MARYLRRLSLIACSFWIGCALQREYTMGQPLKCSFHNDLQKCPVENRATRVKIGICKKHRMLPLHPSTRCRRSGSVERHRWVDIEFADAPVRIRYPSQENYT